MRVKEIMDWIEEIAPLYLQESYDNSGLIIGSEEKGVDGAVVGPDVEEAVLE